MNNKVGSNSRSTLVFILLVGLLGMMGGSLMGPVLPALSQRFSVSGGSVGLAITVYAAASALSFPFMGYFTDRYGRKNVLIPSLILNGLAGILCFIAPSFNFLLVFRTIQGVGIAGMAPMAIILIGDLYSGSKKVSAMGNLSSTRAAGGVIAPLLGGTLASLSWNLPFLVYSTSIPLAIILWFWFPFPNKGESESIKEYLKPMSKVVKNPKVQSVLLLNFTSFFLVYTVVTFIPQHLSNIFNVSEAFTGLFLAFQAIATISLALNSGKLVQITKKRNLIGIGFLISGTGFIILPIKGMLLWIVFTLMIFGLGRGLYQPQVNTLVTEVAPEGRLGGMTSLNNIARYAGQMASPFILGIIRTQTNFQTVFLISGLIGTFTGLTALTITYFNTEIF